MFLSEKRGRTSLMEAWRSNAMQRRRRPCCRVSASLFFLSLFCLFSASFSASFLLCFYISSFGSCAANNLYALNSWCDRLNLDVEGGKLFAIDDARVVFSRFIFSSSLILSHPRSTPSLLARRAYAGPTGGQEKGAIRCVVFEGGGVKSK